MQKHIIVIIVLLASLQPISAQPVKDGEPVNSVSYKSISTFQASSVADKVVFILDTLRGGTFTLYSGNMPADGGIIIQNANGKKYIRQISGNEVNLLWWGAMAEDEKFDNRPALLNCINAVQAISQDDNWAKNPYFLKKYKIYIPGAPKKYFISGDSLLITHTIRLEGDAGYTRLGFAKKGLVFTYPGAAGSVVNGISLYGSINYNNPDTSWYGIRVKCQVDFREVQVRQFYNGLEILADAAVKPGHPMYGNSNNSVFKQVHCVLNGGNGIYVKGGDANNISFEQVDVVSNTLWGVCDQNFLGNTYTMGHAASNASPELPYNKTIAVRKGVVYAAIRNGYLPDPLAPGAETFWWKWCDSTKLYQPYPFPYNPRKYYRTGGAYNLDGENLGGENQRSSLLNCYSEADQPASCVGQSSFILGGDHGAGIRRGAYLGAYNNHLFSTSKFTVGMEGSNRAGILDTNYIRIQSGYTEGIGLSYDPRTKMGTMGYPPYEAAFQNIYFTTPQTPPALLNRSSNVERSVIIPNGIYTGEIENNTDYRRITRSRNKPATQKMEIGDIALASHQTAADSPDDVFGYSKNAGGVVVSFKGYAEYETTTTDGRSVVVLNDPVATNSSQAYELIIMAQSGGNATYYCRKECILSRNPGSTATLVMPVRDVTPEYRSQGIGKGIGPVITAGNGGLTLAVTGEAGKTFTWKIQVRRT